MAYAGGGAFDGEDSNRLFIVLASHGPQVHIDRGSLHEVRERDIYAVYDSSGKYKGKIETRGIGDHQSIGRLYAGTKKEVEPGDTVKFLGQRKFFGLGVHVARDVFTQSKEDSPIEDMEPISGGGLVWWWTFPGDWGFKWVWGWYETSYYGPVKYFGSPTGEKIERDMHYAVRYSFPLTIRKNFFYPGMCSPYLGITIGHYNSVLRDLDPNLSDRVNFDNSGYMISPTVGLELFSTRLVHIFMEALYLQLPELENRGTKHRYNKWIVSAGITTNW